MKIQVQIVFHITRDGLVWFLECQWRYTSLCFSLYVLVLDYMGVTSAALMRTVRDFCLALIKI